MSLSNRFFITVSLPVLVCLAVLSILLFRVSSHELEIEHERRLLGKAEQIRTLLADSIEFAKSDLTLLLANKTIEQYLMYADMGELDYEEDLRATLEDNFLSVSYAKPRYASLRLFTLDGDGIVNITKRQRAYRYPEPNATAWFSEAKRVEKDQVYVSRVHPCPEHSAPSVFVNKLFYYWDRPRLIASISIHLQDYLSPLLSEINLEQVRDVYIVDSEGMIIVDRDAARLGQTGGNAAVVKELLENGKGVKIGKEANGGGLESRIYFSLDLSGAIGVIAQPMTVITGPVNKLKMRLAGIAVAIAAIFFILIFISSRAIIRPLAKLEKTTKQIAAGDLDARVGITGKDEIGSLSASFDVMTDKLQKSEQDLRKALAEVKTLSGFLPICASCKKIRDDKGYWNQIETYIRKHSNAEFSHGFCPDCAERLHGEIDRFKENKGKDL